MSLVAYDSSDSENENELKEPEVEKTASVIQVTNSKNLKKCQLSSSKDEETSTLNNFDNEISDEEEKYINFMVLPEPIQSKENKNIAQTDQLPMPKKVDYGVIEKPSKQEKRPAKIVIPSLSNFKDEHIPRTSQIKKTSSKKGSGLLGILPPPKSSTSLNKVNSLIPNAISRKPVETKSQTSSKALVPQSIKPIQKENCTQTKLKSTLQSRFVYHSDSEDDDDESMKKSEKSGMDFFSLSSPTKIPDDSLLPMNSAKLDNLLHKNKKENDHINLLEEVKPIMKLSSTVMDLPKEEILLKNKAEVGPKLPVPEQEYHVDSQGNVAFDDKAIEYLCGKRGVKRRNEFENVDIVEISGEDIKPDERDWLVKALTEEQVHRPISVGAGPSGQSKKKHQITYLAHQAKAMELELKNQWAQNKATKQQSRAKYGF